MGRPTAIIGRSQVNRSVKLIGLSRYNELVLQVVAGGPSAGVQGEIIEAWDQGSVFWSVHRRWNLGGQCNKMAGRSVWGNLLLPCRHSRTIYPRDIESLPFFGGLQLFSQWVGSHRVQFNFGKWQVLFEGQGQQIASPVRETSRSMGVRGHRLHHSKRTLHMHGWVSIYIFLCVCLNLNV